LEDEFISAERKIERCGSGRKKAWIKIGERFFGPETGPQNDKRRLGQTGPALRMTNVGYSAALLKSGLSPRWLEVPIMPYLTGMLLLRRGEEVRLTPVAVEVRTEG
jgi:hypothetical protein